MVDAMQTPLVLMMHWPMQSDVDARQDLPTLVQVQMSFAQVIRVVTPIRRDRAWKIGFADGF